MLLLPSISQVIAALPLPFAWLSSPDPTDAPLSVPTPCRTQLWDVPTAGLSNILTSGWDMLPVSARTKVHDGAVLNRTYAHHPILLAVDNTVLLVHSSQNVDEDSMGQEMWARVSHDGGFTWSDPSTMLEGALLPNQSSNGNWTHWCDLRIPQRAWEPNGIVQSPVTKRVYVTADSTNWICYGDPVEAYNRGAGRIARPIDLQTGRPAGEACWLYKNDYADTLLRYNETLAYGNTTWCEEIEVLNQVLGYPDQVPAWSAVLFNHKYYASDGTHDVHEVTHGVLDSSSSITQRFWRDVSPEDNTRSVWTECTTDYESWYPHTLPLDGGTVTNDSHPILQTDIPDQKTKQYFGHFSTPTKEKVRYLASNPRRNTENDRFPLTLAWQGFDQTDADWTFKSIGIIATDPDQHPVPDTRDFKNLGFSYPYVVQVGGNLVIAYSENKQNIWVSVVPIASLWS